MDALEITAQYISLAITQYGLSEPALQLEENKELAITAMFIPLTDARKNQDESVDSSTFFNLAKKMDKLRAFNFGSLTPPYTPVAPGIQQPSPQPCDQ